MWVRPGDGLGRVCADGCGGRLSGRGWQREESCRGGAGRGPTLRLGHHTHVRCSPFCTAHALGPPVLIPEMDAEIVGAEGMWARLP